jgi:hypothetical protein
MNTETYIKEEVTGVELSKPYHPKIIKEFQKEFKEFLPFTIDPQTGNKIYEPLRGRILLPDGKRYTKKLLTIRQAKKENAKLITPMLLEGFFYFSTWAMVETFIDKPKKKFYARDYYVPKTEKAKKAQRIYALKADLDFKESSDLPKMSTIEEVRNYIHSKGLPQPNMLVQTNFHNFHPVWFFEKPLTRNQARKLAPKLNAALAGDKNANWWGLSCIRLPGTIRDNGFVVNYQKVHSEKLELATLLPLIGLKFAAAKVPEIPTSAVAPSIIKKKIPNLKKAGGRIPEKFLKIGRNKKRIAGLIRIIAAQNGIDVEAPLNQGRIANTLKGPRHAIIKLLKKMIAEKWLTVVKAESIPGVKSMTYRVEGALREFVLKQKNFVKFEALKKSNTPKIEVIPVGDAYELAGEVIRPLIRQGLKDDEILAEIDKINKSRTSLSEWQSRIEYYRAKAA